MVDVGHKPVSRRTAVAEGFIRIQRSTLRAIARDEVPKGEVLSVARLAGIMAAKRTGELIPLCHPLPVESIEVDFDLAGHQPRRRRFGEIVHQGDRPHQRQDGRRNGSPHRRVRRRADDLRHVQGHR